MRTMNLQYVKRFRMELNLRRRPRPPVELPVGYRLVPWHGDLVPVHAEMKYQSFRGGLDAQVFPCLGQREGCRRLMEEIGAKEGFLPEATWLIKYLGDEHLPSEYCGTIQVIRTHRTKASIQNIGVVPHHRGEGLGTCLISAALVGIQQLGIPRLGLEVTAENLGAVRLYRRLGFAKIRTLYKSVELVGMER